MNIDIRDPSLYADWTAEQLQDHVEMLKGLMFEKAGHAPKQTLAEMLDPNGSNFMGSGKTAMEYFAEMQVEQLARSFYSAMRPERTRRMKFVIAMAQIVAEIESINICGTAIARGFIEDVIEGNWPSVRTSARDYSRPHLDTWAKEVGITGDVLDQWGALAVLMQEAFDTRPDAPAPPAPKN